jgi:hypothetical protein
MIGRTEPKSVKRACNSGPLIPVSAERHQRDQARAGETIMMVGSLIVMGLVALSFECVGLALVFFGLCAMLVKLAELPISP